MPKAKSRSEFITTWNEHIDSLALLALTFDYQDYEMLEEVREIQTRLRSMVKVASKNVDV